MPAGTAYLERHNHVAGIVYRNICAEYGENDRAKILWDYQIQPDKMVMADQPDIVVINKWQSKVVLIDVASPSDSNINKKELVKLEKYQGLREELEKMCKVKATVVPSGNQSTRGCNPVHSGSIRSQEKHQRSLSESAHHNVVIDTDIPWDVYTMKFNSLQFSTYTCISDLDSNDGPTVTPEFHRMRNSCGSACRLRDAPSVNTHQVWIFAEWPQP
ncbi:uncharacterized protein LOC117958165 [Etheostoma cragini]|uniref:uncharacterized protein LOC117958165 n=1 Tax=Etheostoma cragini TaxID=417921 RepID=UPI00155E18D2|nr:uncharacterized protein LOC117958165 [Etheostoma cragini]